MHVLVIGGSGFIGTALSRELRRRGHAVRVLDRVPPQGGGDYVVADVTKALPAGVLDGIGGIVNLAGSRIDVRWTSETKAVIQASRVLSTRMVVDAVRSAAQKPAVLVNASAVGFYGEGGDRVLDESAPKGGGFLADVCEAWETEARKAEALGLRVVRMRTGLVLGGNGGLLTRLVPVFRWGLGGPLAGGKQWFPWVHVDDIIGLYAFALENADVHGALNATAPGAATGREFARALGAALHRPAFFPVPAFGLRMVLGEFATSVLLSQRVSSGKAIAHGYRFVQEKIGPAVSAALQSVVS